jgi:glycolate oxidase FAD binding subunit
MTVHMTTDALLAQVAPYVEAGTIRPGGPTDAIDGVGPRIVAEPTTGQAVSEILRWACTAQLAVSVRGGGTKLAWGRCPGPIDVALSTARLNKVVEHRHGDLTATIEAGATLTQVNEALGSYRQWLPLDPPWPDRATVGGVVATNDSGPSRHWHGAPRDLIIGVTVARPDGIVDATFKVTPVAVSSRTLTVDLETVEALEPALAAVMASSLTPSAVEVAYPPARLLVRFQSVEQAVEKQASEAKGLVESATGGHALVVAGEAEREVWANHSSWWDGDGTLLKVSTLPQAFIPTMGWIRDECDRRGLRVAAQGRAGLAVFYIRLDGPADAQGRLIDTLRDRFPIGEGSVVMRRASQLVREVVDPWGPLGDGQGVMKLIKKRFDPESRLNAGRGPV